MITPDTLVMIRSQSRCGRWQTIPSVPSFILVKYKCNRNLPLIYIDRMWSDRSSDRIGSTQCKSQQQSSWMRPIHLDQPNTRIKHDPPMWSMQYHWSTFPSFSTPLISLCSVDTAYFESESDLVSMLFFKWSVQRILNHPWSTSPQTRIDAELDRVRDLLDVDHAEIFTQSRDAWWRSIWASLVSLGVALPKM